MESALKLSSVGLRLPSPASHFHRKRFPSTRTRTFNNISAISSGSSGSASNEAEATSIGHVHRRRSKFESLFCYDKTVPEERIEKPIGITLVEKRIGDNPRCIACEAKGAVLCSTCSGSGLYVDSILESQGIIVKVRCLGCGGTGNNMCVECGGWGHL